MKKILCTLLTIVCTLGLICACTTENSVTPSPSDGENTPTPSVSASPDNTATTIADFKIIYSATDVYARDIAMNLRTKFLSDGIKLGISDDMADEVPNQYEILIGDTNREETLLALKDVVLKNDDYFIKTVNDKIVVYALTTANYNKAISELYSICSANNDIESISSINVIHRFGNSPDGFFIDGVSIENFSIVMPNSSKYFEIKNEIIDKIYQTTGYKLSFADESTPTDYEIIIGDAARDEVTQAKADLNDLDYAVKIINGKIVIVGGTNSMTNNAYDLFVSNFLDTKADKKDFVSQENNVVYRHEYPVSSIKLLGYDISEYVILAKKEDDRAATVIQEYINDLTGIKIDIVTSGNPQKAIILGNVGTRQYEELTVNLKKDEYIIKTVGTRVYLGTVGNEDYYEDGPAVHKFIEDYFGYDFVTCTVKNSTVEVNEIDDVAKIDDYLMKVADEDFLAEIDAKAESLRNSIVNSTTDVTYTGTAYYVSNDGNDENDGLTPETSWATLDRVNKAKELKKGDAVFFKRGDIFRGSLGALEGVTYSAYGEGVKPRLWLSPVDGAVEYEWIEVAPDVWKYTYNFGDTDIGGIILNHGEKVAIKICPDYSQTPVLNDWTKEPFSYKTMNTMDLYFYCATDKEFSPLVDTDYGYLYMCCKSGNPANVFDSIEFNVDGRVISCDDNTTIDNLWIQYCGAHGIDAGKNYCTIQNCEISYVGGCYQGNGDDVRYGNGIELWGDGYEFTVKNCYVHDCFDTGITQQGGDEYENIYYYNNLLERTNANIEYFQYTDDSTIAGSYIKNFLIYDNICRYAGYGWGSLRSGNVSGGPYFHITGLGSCRRPEGDTSAFYNNIFQYSNKWLTRTLAGREDWLIPYYDNIFIEYEGGYVGSAANTTGDKHGVYSTFDYTGIDSWEYRKNKFYIAEK